MQAREREKTKKKKQLDEVGDEEGICVGDSI